MNCTDKIDEILNSDFVKRLSRLYPIKIWQLGANIFAAIELQDKEKKLVDVITITADESGNISTISALHFIAIAFEMGLENEMRKKGSFKRRYGMFK